jgi:hypothetical protein
VPKIEEKTLIYFMSLQKGDGRVFLEVRLKKIHGKVTMLEGNQTLTDLSVEE